MKKRGLNFLTGHKVTGGTNNGDSATINVEPVKGGESISLTADNVLIATGRRPVTKGLGLENVGINVNEKGIIPINANF